MALGALLQSLSMGCCCNERMRRSVDWPCQALRDADDASKGSELAVGARWAAALDRCKDAVIQVHIATAS